MMGRVFNIQRFSTHDGQGIRTTVFLKGCPLHCFWCHNPEGIKPAPEIQFTLNRCILCGECVQVCQQHAHEILDGRHTYDRSLCVKCEECIINCCAMAMEVVGREMSVDEVMAEVLRDRPFYAPSHGGVTLSGGEPLLQAEFSRAILMRSKEEGIHTAIETSANSRWDLLESLLPVTDLILMDIKHMDPKKHLEATGVSNARILANARKLAQTAKHLTIHTPVVPTVNDTKDEIVAIAQFVAELNLIRLGVDLDYPRITMALLPFHKLAADKYKGLGLDYQASQLEPPSQEKIQELNEILQYYDVKTQ